MTREEAIAILNNVIHKTINGETDPNEVEALDMAIEALKQEPCEDCVSRKAFYERFLELPSVTPQESRWIPVTERLPEVEEEAKRYLVTVEVCGSFDDYTAIRPYFSDTKDFNDAVTAWMPLPEPYKGGE